MQEVAHASRLNEQRMCRAKTQGLQRFLLRVRDREPTLEDVPPHFFSEVVTKKLNTLNCWSKLRADNRRDASFSACVCKKQRFRSTPCGWKKRNASAPKSKRVNVLFLLSWRNRVCQTLKSRVRSAVLRSRSRNGNRSITGNVTWLTRSDVSPAAMHGVLTSAAQKHKEESVRDLISPAISVVRTIQCRSSHHQAGRFYAAIVLARVARNKGPDNSGGCCEELASGITPRNKSDIFPTRWVLYAI